MNPAPLEAAFDTYRDYRLAVADLLTLADRRVSLFDPDLRQTGLETAASVRLLTQFLARSHDQQLRIVLHDTSYAERQCPRLLALLRDYGHCVGVRRSPDDLRHLSDCYLGADARHAAIRFHRDHARGKLLIHKPDDVGERQRRFDELWELSLPALAATTLGL
jgi:hypothetical protein